MGPIVADMSMSLDGFVADTGDGVDAVFTWYGRPQPTPNGLEAHRAPGVEDITAAVGMGREVGAILYGRRTFNVAKGWGGSHPIGVPVVVVSHDVPDGWPRPDGRVLFAPDLESALELARRLADGKPIAVGSPSIAQQLLNRGLLDGIHVSLVPVFLGDGIRFFEHITSTPRQLDGPFVVEGNGVTQLYYRVPR